MWTLIGGCSQPTETTELQASPTPSVSLAQKIETLPQQEISISEHIIKVEVACTPEQQSKGLMFREELSKDHGMLFIFDREQTLAFWMKNTLIPLDIAYLDSSGTIVDIQTMQAGTTQTYPSSEPAQYAIEMNKGWFANHKISAGERIKLPNCS